MSEMETVILKLQSVVLTREKQGVLQEELGRYVAATNWVIKVALKSHLVRPTKIIETASDEFSKQFDKRPEYLADVVKTASSEIARHRRLARTIRSMRDKSPFFKPGRAIYSQPIVTVSDKGITLTLHDRTHLPIPFDKFSRNKMSEELNEILKGEPVINGRKPQNKRYNRVRLTWNKEGFLGIDIQANIPRKAPP